MVYEPPCAPRLIPRGTKTTSHQHKYQGNSVKQKTKFFLIIKDWSTTNRERKQVTSSHIFYLLTCIINI